MKNYFIYACNRRTRLSFFKLVSFSFLLPLFLFVVTITGIKAYAGSVTGPENSRDYKYILSDNNPSIFNPDKGYKFALVDELPLEESKLYAQSSEPSPALSKPNSNPNTKDWQVIVAIYLWLSGLNGEIGLGDKTANVDVSFGDIMKNFDIGGQAHAEFWWKRWIFFIDPTYIKLAANNNQTRILTSTSSGTEVKEFLFEFGAGYRVAELPLGSNINSNEIKAWPNLLVDLYGGGRILYIDSELNLKLTTPAGTQKFNFNGDEGWLDFIIGTRLIFDITKKLVLTAKTDIGGFGLSFSSDISWNLVANIGYELPWYGITPYVGYRILYIDYRDGSGDNRFVYDIWQTGPQVGVAVRF